VPWECDHERHTYEKYVSQLFITLTGALNVLVLNRCQYDECVLMLFSVSGALGVANFDIQLCSSDEGVVETEVGRSRGSRVDGATNRLILYTMLVPAFSPSTHRQAFSTNTSE